MRKISSFLLMALLAVGLAFNADAAVTVKVNKTGVLYFKSFGSSGETTLNDAVNILPNDCNGMTVGEIHCPAGYSMTAVNETTGAKPDITDYDDETYISVNPGTAPDGTVFNITVSEGGGGEEPAKTLTFVFSPAGSGYVVTAHANDAGITIEDDTYTAADGEDTIEVPYQGGASYIIKPNPGFALVNAKDESQSSNPHYSGDVPRGDGYIYGDMSMYTPGDVIVVSATRNGSFTVKGIGDNLEEIVVQNLSTYANVAVTSTETAVSFAGNTQYKIYTTASSPLWKVEVTDAEDYTTSLSGNYGNFFYTPNDGDKVVVYTAKPQMYCKFNLSFSGTGIDNNIIKSVWYGDNQEDENTWANGTWTKEGEGYLRIYFNNGYNNIGCKVNGTSLTVNTNSQGEKYVGFQCDNGSQILKDYNIVVSAQKDVVYNLTLVCDEPTAVSVYPVTNYTLGTPLAFTQSGQTFQIKQTANKLKFAANSGWLVDGILIDGELPAAGEFVDGYYFVNSNCTIKVLVSNLAAKRTKTATVYVDETVPSPMYLDFKYADKTSVTVVPGYNFIPFCDDDLPFSFGYYAGSSAVFYVNDVEIYLPNECPETANLQDGAVIKYFNGTPTIVPVKYEVDKNVEDLIEIFHDYTTAVDHTVSTQYACARGTLIHIKAKAAAQSAKARVTDAPFMVKVDDALIDADENGVYSVKVGETAPVISIAKDFITTGIEDIFAEAGNSLDIINLQGIVVKRNATVDDFNALPAGVYIANGRKLIKK